MKIAISALLFLSTAFTVAHRSTDPLQESIKRGAVVYENYCTQCHMGAGEGVPDVFPPLAKSDYLLKKTEQAIHAIKFGQQGEITVNGKTYNSYMPAPGLSDEEIADVMNYILNSWGNKYGKMITQKAVEAVKE